MNYPITLNLLQSKGFTDVNFINPLNGNIERILIEDAIKSLNDNDDNLDFSESVIIVPRSPDYCVIFKNGEQICSVSRFTSKIKETLDSIKDMLNCSDIDSEIELLKEIVEKINNLCVGFEIVVLDEKKEKDDKNVN